MQAQNAQKPSAKPSSTRPGSSSQGTSSPSSQAQLTPAQQQRQAAEEAERLRQLAQQDEALTELANRRMDAATRTVQQSSQSIEAERDAQAALEARMAARKLESVGARSVRSRARN